MNAVFETIKVPDGADAWVYLFSENNITAVPAHWHFSVELTFMCRGQALYTINGRHLTLRQGDLILINSGDVHRCHINPASCEGINIMFPNNYFAQYVKGEAPVLFKLNSQIADFDCLVRKCTDLYSVFTNRREDPYAQLRINSLVCDISWLLLTCFQWSIFTPLSIVSEKYRKRCRDITDYIDLHFREQISMKTLTNTFYISKEHLARIFRKYMGTTFKKHLDKVRTYHAYRMLIGSDLAITQIAMECGFSDVRSFISAFRKIYSITPGKYRHEYYEEVHQSFGGSKRSAVFDPQPLAPLKHGLRFEPELSTGDAYSSPARKSRQGSLRHSDGNSQTPARV
jgi:AraC-like DNA-binding protein